MRFTKKTQYGIMFALYLARTERSGTRQAAEALAVSPTFLEHVVMDLRQAGVITVKRGPGGGASLRADATLLDVVAALEKDVVLNEEDVRFYELGATQAHKQSLLLFDMAASQMKGLLGQTVKSLSKVENYVSGRNV